MCDQTKHLGKTRPSPRPAGPLRYETKLVRSYHQLRNVVIWWGKEAPMDYEAPRLEVVGSASELIQAFFGPHSDGDGYQFSQGLICDPRET